MVTDKYIYGQWPVILFLSMLMGCWIQLSSVKLYLKWESNKPWYIFYLLETHLNDNEHKNKDMFFLFIQNRAQKVSHYSHFKF